MLVGGIFWNTNIGIFIWFVLLVIVWQPAKMILCGGETFLDLARVLVSVIICFNLVLGGDW